MHSYVLRITKKRRKQQFTNAFSNKILSCPEIALQKMTCPEIGLHFKSVNDEQNQRRKDHK